MSVFSLIVPTRGRTEPLRRLLDSILRTAQAPDSIEVVTVVDQDDEDSLRFAYPALRVERVVVPPGQTMGNLNLAGYRAAHGRYLMLLNDDVVAQTPAWDARVREVLERYADGIVLVHVNDGIFRDTLCTFPLLTREFCELAGGICRPEYRRYRIDDHLHHVFDLLDLLGYRRRVFLPDVVFQHFNAVPGRAGTAEYIPDPAIHESDTREFEARIGERRRLALACVERMEGPGNAEEQAARLRLLGAFPDAIALRLPERARQWSDGDPARGARILVAVIAQSAHEARGCLEMLRGVSPEWPVAVVACANDAVARCRADYLVLMDPAVRVGPGWLDGGLQALASGAAIARAEGVLLLDMPVCGCLRFDGASPEALAATVERARASGMRTAEWSVSLRRVDGAPPAAAARPTSGPPAAVPAASLAARLWGAAAIAAAHCPPLAKWRLGVPPALFDAAWYRHEYPDVSGTDRQLLIHYLRRGGFEGRNPNRHFDSAWYLAANPDVAASRLNPLVHFVRFGAREGRSPNPLFDLAYYTGQNPRVPAGINALEHFMSEGLANHRAPSASVSLQQYLRRLAPESPAPLVSANGLPPLSVIVPTRDRADLLARMLDACVRNSAGCELELLVVDDGSRDATPALLRELARRIPNLRWQSVSPGGPARARNAGATLARYDVLLFLGDDILPADREFFRRHAALHGQDPGRDFAVLGQIDWPRDPGFAVNFVMKRICEDGTQFAYPRLAPGSFVGWRYFYTSNVSVKKALVRDWMAEGFDSGFSGAALEDTELAYRLSTSRPGLRLYYEAACVGLHYHPYTLGRFLERQVFAGACLRRMLELHPELTGEFGVSEVRAALHRPGGDGSGEPARDTAAVLDAVKAAALIADARGQLGTEAWHGEWVTALCEICFHAGYVAAWPPAEVNAAAARAVLLGRFFARLRQAPGFANFPEVAGTHAAAPQA